LLANLRVDLQAVSISVRLGNIVFLSRVLSGPFRNMAPVTALADTERETSGFLTP
jgi:hypothetical protein